MPLLFFHRLSQAPRRQCSMAIAVVAAAAAVAALVVEGDRVSLDAVAGSALGLGEVGTSIDGTKV